MWHLKKHHKGVFATEEIWRRNCIPGYELQYTIIGTVIDFTKNYSVNFYHHFVNACVFGTVTGLQFNILSTDVTKCIKSSMRWRGHVTYTRDMRNENKILSFYPDNLNDRDTSGTLIGQYIKLDFRVRRWEVYDWTHLSQDTVQSMAFVNMTMNPWVLQKAEHSMPSWGPIIISWQALIHGVLLNMMVN